MEKIDLEYIKNLIELVKDDPLLLLFVPVVIIIPILFKAKSILSFIDERKKSKLENISSALNCKYIEGLTKEHLKNEVVNEHFYLSTGINIEKELREAILKSHSEAKGKLTFTHYKRALKYLRCKENDISLEVKSKQFDKYANWFLTGYSFVIGVLGLFLISTLAISKGLSIMQYLAIIGVGLFFIFFAIVMFSQTFSFYSAMKIKTELEKEKEKEKEKENLP